MLQYRAEGGRVLLVRTPPPSKPDDTIELSALHVALSVSEARSVLGDRHPAVQEALRQCVTRAQEDVAASQQFLAERQQILASLLALQKRSQG